MFASPSPGLLGLLLAKHMIGTPLVADGRTTCAREATTTRCWGENEFLYGAGVTDFPGVHKWALKAHRRCVLTERSGLLCDASRDPTVRRIDDPGAPPVQDFALTSDGGCTLGADGIVDCWRWDNEERPESTGSGEVVTDAVQIVVTGEPPFTSPCVKTRAGAVVCWTPECRVAPHVVLRDVVALASDRHLCATHRDGSIACWRAPDGCEDAGTESRVEGIEDAASVAVGHGLACALRSRGGVTCWSMDATGLPGRPRSIAQTEHATRVAVGDRHACARDVVDQVWCWGDNSAGQLGQYDGIDELMEPTEIPGIDDAVALAGNGTSTCALLADGRVECWGRDDDSSEWNATPAVRADLPPALRLFPFGFHTMCVELRGGELRCWGRQQGSDIRRPKAATAEILGAEVYPLVCVRSRDRVISCTYGVVPDGPAPISIQLPPTNLFALDAPAGVLHGVTRPGYSQIQVYRHSVPQRDLLTASLLVTGLSASYDEVCAVDILGAVTCADRRDGGALAPARSMDLVDVVELSAGTEHTCARDIHGRIQCWGDNSRFQLGQATAERHSAAPLRVPGVENVVQVVAVVERTCALVASGAVYCWGSNDFGTSGVGSGASSQDPVPVRPPLAAIHGTENLALFLPSTPLK